MSHSYEDTHRTEENAFQVELVVGHGPVAMELAFSLFAAISISKPRQPGKMFQKVRKAILKIKKKARGGNQGQASCQAFPKLLYKNKIDIAMRHTLRNFTSTYQDSGGNTSVESTLLRFSSKTNSGSRCVFTTK